MTTNQRPAPTLEILLAHVVNSCRLTISPEAAAEKTLAGLGLDSLELMNMAMELEDNFGLELDLETVTAETTLGELIQKVLASRA
jgi:acyl carrier protein